ncbi:MAG: neutral/alkaline non-lysosomal ceramidase N-terminal domain-containing protein [Acidobacteria bacterium]|nr:neutral/alkaline non-lysosomal ceramidase N-terminal domain-containing protein [Acidobacteriota bacterium]
MKTPIVVLSILAAAALPARPGELRAGAARVEITPARDAALPMAGYASRAEGHKTVHDPLFVRALVLEDGATSAAIVSLDLIFAPENLWSRITARVEREAGIPPHMVLLAATHTHAGPTTGAVKPEFEERWKAWMAATEDKIVQAVREAKASLRPARYGAATGKASVNTNRRARTAAGGWGLGVNPEGPSDKTVGVIRFETLQGEPIAVLINYCVHGTVTGPQNYALSGDLPGAAERFVEQQMGDKVVALWTSGASGDQNAIYGPGNDLRQVALLGTILGEEIVRVAKNVRTTQQVRLQGAQRVIACPGQRMTPESKTGTPNISFVDADPVNVRVSVLTVGHLALAGVSGEVLTAIGTRVKRESPFAFTVMTTHTNGSSGYIADDASYDQVSYEIWTTRLKRGCAETAIVGAALDMMDRM